MIHKDREFSTITYPNWFWKAMIEIINNTDEFWIKAIIRDENQNDWAEKQKEFYELFEQLKSEFEK